MELYKFVLMYKESDKKLREMLNNARQVLDMDQSTEPEHKPNVIVFEENTDLGTNGSKWTTPRSHDRKKDQINSYASESGTYLDCDIVNKRVILFGQYDADKSNVLNGTAEFHKIKTENVMDDDLDSKQFIPNEPISDPIAVKWKCKKCSSEFQTQRLLRMHSKMHLFKKAKTKIKTDRKQSQCTICLDKFPSNKVVQKHMREQHGHKRKERKSKENTQNCNENLFVCDYCNKSFNTKNKIKHHLVTHINEGRIKYLCVTCGNQFCSKFGLTQHIRAIHDKEQRFQCTKCDRRFAHKHNLKTHMNRHEGVRPYACIICPKTFYDSSTLNVHTKSVHSNSNSYECNICSKTFNRNGNLKIHMVKTHHLQQPKPQGSIQRVNISPS